MALSSPESPVPPRRVVINRTENPSEEHEELNKMVNACFHISNRPWREGPGNEIRSRISTV